MSPQTLGAQSLNAPAERYGWGLIALHWLTLALIAAAVGVAWALDDMPLSPLKLKLIAWHKWLGLGVLALLPLRLIVRRRQRFDAARGLTPLERRLSLAVHGALYGLMLVVPLLGWLGSSAAGFSVVWFGVLPLPDLIGKDKALSEVLFELHEAAVAGLLGLVALHAAAALMHHFARKDAVLARMAPWLRRR